MEAGIRGKSWAEGKGETSSLGLPGIALLQSGCTLPRPGFLAPPSSPQCLWGTLQQVPGGAPSPIKVRTSPVSHPTAISSCILGAVYFKPASGGASLGPPWAQRLGQVYWRWWKSAPCLWLLCALTCIWLHREERHLKRVFMLVPSTLLRSGVHARRPSTFFAFSFSSEQP